MSLGYEAYHAGRRAHDAGIRLKDNPYKGTSQEEHWRQGWLYGRAWKKAQVTRAEAVEISAKVKI